METMIQPQMHSPNNRQRKIAYLNDQLRINGIGGQIIMTRGVQSIGTEAISNIFHALQTYSSWNMDNDLYHEHDFGVISLIGLPKIYFKIDYYDKQMEWGSEDPADPQKTMRVLTVLLAEEY